LFLKRKRYLTRPKKESYLGEKFFSGQETAIKVKAITVAQKMRRSKDEARVRRVTCDEFLTPCHV